MGIFSKKKRPSQVIEDNEAGREMEADTIAKKRPVRLGTYIERMGYIKDNCEIILEGDRQTEEAKIEYQAVTSYLTDMQRIDAIPKDQRENLEEAARKLVNLNKERIKLQRKSSVLSERMYQLYEGCEKQLPKEMKSIREAEEYQAVIQKDIMYLEKERTRLYEEQEEIISKQSFLKGIAVTTSVIVVVLFLLFAVLARYSEASFTIPFLLTVLMGMALALYIFMEARRNSGNIRLVQMKQNRQIMLMNKVSIKSVNNRNYLDYFYNKYMVLSYEQLTIAWEEYVRIKDEERRYQSNTELLEFFNNELIQELKKYGVADSEIWIYQPTAILDNKEMVEVRHRLNVRRQKLRERIEACRNQSDEALTAIQQLIKSYPEGAPEYERLLRQYRIEME